MPSKYANHSNAPRDVAIILFKDTKLIDVCGPLQVFSDARLPDERAAYRVTLLSLDGGPVSTDTVAALPTQAIAQYAKRNWDTVLVSGGSSAYVAATSKDLIEAVGKLAKGARRLGSICLGAFILAAGGLLNNRRATTHWEGCARLAAEHPSIDVVEDTIFIADEGVWTSAGVTSGIDMALAMVEEDLGRSEALRLAKSLVLPARRAGGQKQFSSSLKAQMASGDSRFAALLADLAANPAQDLSIVRMAALANMSERHFSRVFTQQVGVSPGRFVEEIRVEHAAELVQQTDLPLKAILSQSGFTNAEQMRRAFQRVKGVSPSEFQAKFGRGAAA